MFNLYDFRDSLFHHYYINRYIFYDVLFLTFYLILILCLVNSNLKYLNTLVFSSKANMKIYDNSRDNKFVKMKKKRTENVKPTR